MKKLRTCDLIVKFVTMCVYITMYKHFPTLICTCSSLEPKRKDNDREFE